jgi:hypothetical protein
VLLAVVVTPLTVSVVEWVSLLMSVWVLNEVPR